MPSVVHPTKDVGGENQMVHVPGPSSRGVLAGLPHTTARSASRQGTPTGGSWYKWFMFAVHVTWDVFRTWCIFMRGYPGSTVRLMRREKIETYVQWLEDPPIFYR